MTAPEWTSCTDRLNALGAVDVAELVASGVRAQPRCGAAKVPTYVCGEWVIKGPATTDTQRGHMRAMVARSLLLSALDPSLALVPCRIVGDYLVLANVGRVDGFETEHRTTKLESIDVVKRGSHVTRVSEARPADLDDAQIDTIWCLFVWMAILNVGDAGTYNLLLARDGRVVAIDMEETRHDSARPATLEGFVWVRAPKRPLAERLLRAGAAIAPPPSWERLAERLTLELTRRWAELMGYSSTDPDVVYASVRERLELYRSLAASRRAAGPMDAFAVRS